MKFIEFMTIYDNWNNYIKVDDDSSNMIIKGKAFYIMVNQKDLWDTEVVTFGFYEGILCVQVR